MTACRDPLAFATNSDGVSTPFAEPRIFLVVFMSGGAAFLRGLECVVRPLLFAGVSHIVGLSAPEQVIRIDTRGIVAGMTGIQTGPIMLR
jgi:hypothetical protein